MTIELRQLRYFLAVAAERNFTRAAARLNMAQPPLSRQIQLIEEELGTQLFDRESRPLQLTSSGRLFYEHAVQITQRMNQMMSAMRQFVAADRKRFGIGFVPSTIYGRLPDIIRAFRVAAPDVELNLIEMTSVEQIAALKEGRIDVGFGRVRFNDPAVRREVLREEELVVALPIGHPLVAGEPSIELSALAEWPIIIYPREPRPSYADQVLSLFRDQGIEPGTVLEVRELQTAIGMVAAEAGLCIVPTSVQRLGRSDVLYRDLAQRATSPIIMSYRSADRSDELEVIKTAIVQVYATWGWPAPPGLVPHGDNG